MRKLWTLLFPAILVLIALVVLQVVDTTDEGPPFVHNTLGQQGSSLLFDTLRHMGYPVAVSRNPLNMDTDINHAHIIIQPAFPPCDCEWEEIMDWVQSGGRLIYLNSPWETQDGTAFGTLLIQEIGDGILVTGLARDVTNYNLMNNPETGTYIHTILTNWNAGQIMFAEYYHHASGGDNFFTRLPLVVRLIFVQMGIVSLFVVWHVGKRFGNAIPYYDETEREENEHVHAVTRLYLKIRRKK